MVTKILHIQIQPEREPTLDSFLVESSLKELDIAAEITEGNDGDKYINFVIETNNLIVTWSKIKLKLMGNSLISNTAIITCEGNNGWDDYLLLHHYDKEEQIDDFGNY